MSARASAISAHTLPAGIVGPGFNDDFGDTFGIIYGFTADGFTHRELRDYVEKVRSELLHVADVSKIEILGAQDERIFVEFSTKDLANLGLDRATLIAALQAQNVVQPAGAVQTETETLQLRVSGAFQSEEDVRNINFVVGGRVLRLSRYRQCPARLCRSAAADVPRQWRARHRPCDRDARRRRHSGARQESDQDHDAAQRRSADRRRAEAGRRSGGDGRDARFPNS